MRSRSIYTFLTSTALFLLGCMIVPAMLAQTDDRLIEISNPYANVNWETDRVLRGNLHTHTTQSDGQYDPDAVIDAYKQRGYDFLAITDHDRVTYPWQDFGRDPQALGMVDIEGNELSQGHHLVSLFNDYATLDPNTLTRFRGVAAHGGIAYFAHPGRYDNDAQWYAQLYYDNPHVFGQAIYNQGDRYPGDREKWDEVLSITMPDRPVWGISEDDMHRTPHFGRNRTYIFATENDHENIREALMEGRFYSTISEDGKTPPSLTGVTIDEHASTITLEVQNYTSIRWISMGKEVATGTTVNITSSADMDRYVRAELQGPEGRTYTNPFGIIFFINRPPHVDAGEDQALWVENTVTLRGIVRDDGRPEDADLRIQWEQLSGEGSVTFATPHAPETTAAFSAPGTYTLQLTADDSEYSVSDTVTITALADNLGCQLGVFDLSANNGINPATGQPWQRGDQYRLVFLSRNPVSAKTPLADDITYWNQAVQLIAERATEFDLGGVTWKIIGSTSGIDARDNTATNPRVHGTGHPILNMEGEVIANNFEHLWGDSESHAAPAYDENGRDFFDADAPPSIITGTNAEGKALAVLRLRDISAMGNIRQGVFNNTRSWKSHSRWFSDADSSVYGMSEPLTIIDRSAE